MPRSRPIQYSSLTSLLDVLFILVFASLIHAASKVEASQRAPQPPEAATEPEAPPDAGVPDATPPDAVVAPAPTSVRQAAAAAVARSVDTRATQIAHVSPTGVVTAVEPAGRPSILVGAPLLQRVDDPDVGLVYLGDDNPALRICAIVAAALDRTDLAHDIVVIVPDASIDQLPVALVEGMRRDLERCAADQGALAVLVDPANLHTFSP